MVTASVFLVCWIVFAPKGIVPYNSLKKKVKKISLENEELRSKNGTLLEEIHKLTHDMEYIGKIAREKYNMLKKNEVIFEFPPPRKRH